MNINTTSTIEAIINLTKLVFFAWIHLTIYKTYINEKWAMDAASPVACSSQFSDRYTTGLVGDYQFNEGLANPLARTSFNQATSPMSRLFGNISLTSALYWCSNTNTAGICLTNPATSGIPLRGFPASTVTGLNIPALGFENQINIVGGWSFEFWYRKTSQNTVGIMMATTACGTNVIMLQPASTESYDAQTVNLCDCGQNYAPFMDTCGTAGGQTDNFSPSNPYCFYQECVQIVNPGQSDQFTYFYGPNIVNTRAFLGAQGNEDLIGSGVPATGRPDFPGFVYTQASTQITGLGLHHYVHTINYPEEQYIDYLDGKIIGTSTTPEGITFWDPYTPFDLQPGFLNFNLWQSQINIISTWCTLHPSVPDPEYYPCDQRIYGPPLQFSFGSNTAEQFWEGEIRYFGIYSQTLTGAQVIQNYEAGPPNSPPVANPFTETINQCSSNSTGSFLLDVVDSDVSELGCIRTITARILLLPPSDQGTLFVSTDVLHAVWTPVTTLGIYYPITALWQFQNNPSNFLDYSALINFQGFDGVDVSRAGLLTINVVAQQAINPPVSLNLTMTIYAGGGYQVNITQIPGGCPNTQTELLHTQQWLILAIGISQPTQVTTSGGTLYLYNSSSQATGRQVIGQKVTTLPFLHDNSTGLRGYLDSVPTGELVYTTTAKFPHSGSNVAYADSFKFRAIFNTHPAIQLGYVQLQILNPLQAIASTVTIVENTLGEIRLQGNDHTYDANNILKPSIPIVSVLDMAVVQSISAIGTFYVVLNPLISPQKIVLNSTHLPFSIPLNLVTGLSQQGRLFYLPPVNASGINLSSLTFYIANATGFRSASSTVSISISPVNLAPYWTTASIYQVTSSGNKNYPIFTNGSIGHVYWDLPLIFKFKVVDPDPFLLPFSFNITLTPKNVLGPSSGSSGKTTLIMPGALGPSANLAYFYSGRNGYFSPLQNGFQFYANGMITNSAMLDGTGTGPNVGSIQVMMGTNTTLGLIQTIHLWTCDNDPTNPLTGTFNVSFIPWIGFINPVP